MSYLEVKYKNIRVSYLSTLEGGGMGFGQTYIPVVENTGGKVGRVFEFCAGPGFIGFSLLAHGLCDTLCLSDINPDAVNAAKRTVQRNNLEDRVSVYKSDCLDQIPSTERWDLVVSNPPHFSNAYHGSIRHYDPEWSIHRRFYSGVGKFLNRGGRVLIQENCEGSMPGDFETVITDSGLNVIGSFMYADKTLSTYLDTYYFILSQQRGMHSERSLPCDGSMIDIAPRIETIPVALEKDKVATVRLKRHVPYRFLFSNELGHDARLLIFAAKQFLVPKFLRSFTTVPFKEQTPSCVFQLYAGDYILRDELAKRPLCRILAS